MGKLRFTGFYILLVAILSWLLLIAGVWGVVELVRHPEAIGHFFGQIVSGFKEVK